MMFGLGFPRSNQGNWKPPRNNQNNGQNKQNKPENGGERILGIYGPCIGTADEVSRKLLFNKKEMKLSEFPLWSTPLSDTLVLCFYSINVSHAEWESLPTDGKNDLMNMYHFAQYFKMEKVAKKGGEQVPLKIAQIAALINNMWMISRIHIDKSNQKDTKDITSLDVTSLQDPSKMTNRDKDKFSWTDSLVLLLEFIVIHLMRRQGVFNARTSGVHSPSISLQELTLMWPCNCRNKLPEFLKSLFKKLTTISIILPYSDGGKSNDTHGDLEKFWRDAGENLTIKIAKMPRRQELREWEPVQKAEITEPEEEEGETVEDRADYFVRYFLETHDYGCYSPNAVCSITVAREHSITLERLYPLTHDFIMAGNGDGVVARSVEDIQKLHEIVFGTSASFNVTSCQMSLFGECMSGVVLHGRFCVNGEVLGYDRTFLVAKDESRFWILNDQIHVNKGAQ